VTDDSKERLTRLVRDCFGALEADLGFALDRIDVRQREFSARFVRGRVSVQLDHEFFYSASVAVRVRPGPEGGRGGQFGLYALLRDAGPEAEQLLPTGPAKDDEALADNLRRQAELLIEFGRDLLEGDLGRALRLRRIQAAEARRQNKEEFGTSTGESPRFSERPSLEALFSDAVVEGLKSPRAYQAFWDWDYPLAEIAAFLGTDEAGVQALLDEWDGI